MIHILLHNYFFRYNQIKKYLILQVLSNTRNVLQPKLFTLFFGNSTYLQAILHLRFHYIFNGRQIYFQTQLEDVKHFLLLFVCTFEYSGTKQKSNKI